MSKLARITCAILMASASAAAAPSAPALAATPLEARMCADLRSHNFSALENGEAATRVLSARFVDAQALSPAAAAALRSGSRTMGAPTSDDPTSLPEHCLVTGYITPTIRFELRLPATDAWNSKFLLAACAGFCGRIDTGATQTALLRNYAAMASDGGHSAFGFDGLWARNNVQTRIDFAYRANHVLLVAAEAISAAYYGEGPSRSYIAGCSKGGHAGIMSALRYPNDFDGVIARGPTINYTEVNILGCGDAAQAATAADGTPLFTADDLTVIQAGVLEACDGADGLEDGLISAPLACAFNPAVLACEPAGGANCLNAEKVAALERLYAPVRDSEGRELYTGVTLGSEWNWPDWLVYGGRGPTLWSGWAASEYLNHLALRNAPDPGWDWTSFDWERDHARLAEMSAMVDADNPDLRRFRDAGGKMIVIHGWADAAVPARETIKWYDEVTQFMGGGDATREFARLFLVPGLNHCDDFGPGPSLYDALELLDRWVEHGEAPEALMTRKEEDGDVVRTRPVYPYPATAHYDGDGDINDAGNFSPAP